jgi:hypothetical protein
LIATRQNRFDCNNSNLGTFDISSSTVYSSGNSGILRFTVNTIQAVRVGPATFGGVAPRNTEVAPNCPVLAQANPAGSGTVPPLALTCSPNPVVRGSTVTCTATGAVAAAVTGWSFSGGGGSASAQGGALTWAGEAVVGGTVTVTTGAGSRSASYSVTARNWTVAAISSTKVANGLIINLPVPPMPTGGDSGLGWFAENMGDQGASLRVVPSNGGPNSGFAYYASPITMSSHYFKYTINPDLENAASIFSTKQYGACTIIARADLLAQTQRHEAGTVVQSHYVNYKSALASNNPGSYAEGRYALPGADQSAFNAQTRDTLTSIYATIGSAAAVEPFPVNYSQTAVSLGNINFSPYIPCP